MYKDEFKYIFDNKLFYISYLEIRSIENIIIVLKKIFNKNKNNIDPNP